MADGGVKFSEVSFTLANGHKLLCGISLQCATGTTTALLGRSGSGKTTLLRTVNALVRPSSGSVRVNNQNVGGTDVLALRRGIGYVIQESGLFPHLSVGRNVSMPLEVAGVRDGELTERAAAAVKRVGLPDDVLARYPWQLSGGQRQRVGVARALITEPKVLLMDEPFGALDPLTRAGMQHMVHDLLAGSYVTTLIVTHDLPEALYLADRVVLMEAGRVVADVAADEVMASEQAEVRAYVQATRPDEKTR